MNKNVKKAAIAVLYTLSIVVALCFQGYYQTSSSNGSKPCPIETIMLVNCGDASSELKCTKTYYDTETFSDDGNGRYNIEALYMNCVKYYMSPNDWEKDPNCTPSATRIIPCE